MTAHDAPPPDLEMRVRIRSDSGRTRLTYTLHSQNGKAPFFHQEIAGPDLTGNPEEWQRRLLHKIEQLGLRRDVDGLPVLRDELDRKLKNLGRDLWKELFPAEIRLAYREFRSSVVSWMIVSDEPWIPWEIVRPYDDSRPDEILDDEFLALRFELTRWLSGKRSPAHHIAVRSLVVVTTADLPQAERESEVLLEIAKARPPLQAIAPKPVSMRKLLRLFEAGDVGLLHFIGHGLHDVAQAEESGIPLPDRSVLRPSDLMGPTATRIGQLRPLVFQNSCWGGQQGWSFTLLGGWAARWVRDCGCGAFLAPLWPSRDKTALSFARTFYTALDRGATLGQAALAARQQVARERPGDPSALAYTVYGHPNARVWFGEIPPEIESPPPAASLPEPLWLSESQAPEALRSRRAWIAAAAALIVFLGVVAGMIPGLWKPEGSSQESFSPIEKEEVAEPPKAPAMEASLGAPLKRSEESRSAGFAAPVEKAPPKGITFRVTGESSLVNQALKRALEKAAKPLVESGVSGWTITLKLDPPIFDSIPQGSVTMESCRLVAQASAQGAGSLIDLELVSSRNAQTNRSEACEAAAGPLAEDVLARFASTL